MIRIINLDSKFIPVPYPEIEYEFIKFNGGELHIKLNTKIDYSKVEKVIITHRIRSSDDLMKIFITKDALERCGIKEFDLIIPYLPYARQDRKCNEGESFTLKVFTNLINSLNFSRVIVFDLHSDVSNALINNCTNTENTYYVEQAINDISDKYSSDIILISPDSGANKKSNILYSKLNIKLNSLVKCDKVRNTFDGSLTGFEVFSNDLKGKECLIVDDICDGGRTFIGIAKELKKKNAGQIHLFVTHGIFSNGFEELYSEFKEIYCTNSFKTFNNGECIQFNIQL